VSDCDREASIVRRLWPTRGCCAMEEAEQERELSCHFVFSAGRYITPISFRIRVSMESKNVFLMGLINYVDNTALKTKIKSSDKLRNRKKHMIM
jgi:hypothetical protein